MSTEEVKRMVSPVKLVAAMSATTASVAPELRSSGSDSRKEGHALRRGNGRGVGGVVCRVAQEVAAPQLSGGMLCNMTWRISVLAGRFRAALTIVMPR